MTAGSRRGCHGGRQVSHLLVVGCIGSGTACLLAVRRSLPMQEDAEACARLGGWHRKKEGCSAAAVRQPAEIERSSVPPPAAAAAALLLGFMMYVRCFTRRSFAPCSWARLGAPHCPLLLPLLVMLILEPPTLVASTPLLLLLLLLLPLLSLLSLPPPPPPSAAPS
jgi:hypothetical protein